MIVLDVMQRGSGIVRSESSSCDAERFWVCEGVILLYVMQRHSGTVKE